MTALADVLCAGVRSVERDGFCEIGSPGDVSEGVFEGAYGSLYTSVIDHPSVLRTVTRAVWGAETFLPELSTLVGHAVDGLDERAVLLDMPCGAGTMFPEIERAGYPGLAIGIDISPTMLGRAVRRAARTSLNVELVRCDALDLPLREGSVDAVLSVNGLHCMPDRTGFLKSIRRVLRPGASAWMTTMVADDSRQRDVVSWVARHGGVIPQPPPRVEDLVSVAEELGFEAEVLGGVGIIGVALRRA